MNSATSKILQILLAVFSVTYVAMLFFFPFPMVETILVGSIVKAIPVSILAVMAFLGTKGRTRTLLVAALVFSVGGDIALSIFSDGKQILFIVGLGLFLVAHVFYIFLFSKDAKFEKRLIPFLAVVVIFALGMAVLLYTKITAAAEIDPEKGILPIPVMVYLSVISVMVSMAIMSKTVDKWLIAGALLFMFSDSVIAINAFVLSEPVMAGPVVIMITYYAGQYLIAGSFLRKNR